MKLAKAGRSHPRIRLVCFGTASGLAWSIVPGLFPGLFSTPKGTIVALLAGLVAGVATTIALRSRVSEAGTLRTVCLGLVSLPAGAFLFGFFHSFLQWAVLHTALEPFTQALTFGVLSSVSVLSLGLFPLAVLTTFLLRAWIRPTAATGKLV